MTTKWLTITVIIMSFVRGTKSIDECLDAMNSDVCSLAQQTCSDPTPGDPAAGDWTCVCPSPSTGTGMAMAATCTLNECTTTCSSCAKTMTGDICSDAGQTCVDQDQAWDSTGNWACLCPPGTDGKASYISPAICAKNECEDQVNYDICFAKHQLCDDPNHLVTSTDDWKCVCADPGVGSAVKAVAVCAFDECVDKFAVCASAGQACVDPTPTLDSLRDWKCVCESPSTGEEVGSVAICTYPAGDECATQSGVCNGPGQVCVDTDTTTPNNWECQCAAPFNGTSVLMAAASCELDECTADCVTCAKTMSGNICTDAGQDCYDINKGALSLNDWQCSCRAPEAGTSQPDAVAVCTMDECTQNAQVCIAADQICVDVDPSPGSIGDWECRCKSPTSGVRTGSAVPTCTYDECTGPAKQVCGAEGQDCIDPNKDAASVDDWQCWCTGTANGNAVAAPANCTFSMGDECDGNTICKNANQQCIDPDFSIPDNWQCSCMAPSTGSPATGKAASCELNECSAICDSCADKGAGNVCTAEHQLCIDTNKSPSSTADWECHCGPLTTLTNSNALGPALCEIDECVPTPARPNPCPADQDCVDPDKHPYSMTDWICTCKSPAIGSGVAVPAVCTLDECIANAYICSAASQVCDDPNKDVSSTDDWECICQTPGQEKATMSQAVCIYDGECSDVNNLIVCSQKGQTCRDPDNMVMGDWMCVCIPPQTGSPAVGVAADCKLDECIHQCNTCADTAHSSGHSYGNTCTDAGQVCNDPNQSPSKTSDWVCSCIPPATGSPVTNGVATCILDECAVMSTSSVCDSIHQTCVDRNTAIDSLGDWECVCQLPWFGSQQAANATCELTPTPAPKTPAPDTLVPTAVPTLVPTLAPTFVPTPLPTATPTFPPTVVPTMNPATPPTIAPTAVPTAVPTLTPTMKPGVPPTIAPTAVPTAIPTVVPTMTPGVPPTLVPTMTPGVPPTAVPTMTPGVPPTAVPTMKPGVPPTIVPTMTPGVPPTATPTMTPGVPPTAVPTMGPGVPPTIVPTMTPGVPPTATPTMTPGVPPTATPTMGPGVPPTAVPTMGPGVPPTIVPTMTPGVPPTATPTMGPGVPPTATPTMGPGVPPTAVPTMGPGVPPTAVPTMGPGVPPTAVPTMGPGVPPTATPTMGPGVPPTAVPTMGPGVPPTIVPTMTPGVPPTANPTMGPGVPPTITPTMNPATPPTAQPPGTTNVPATMPPGVPPTDAPLPSTAPPGARCGLYSTANDCALDALCKWGSVGCASAASPDGDDDDSPILWIIIITVIVLICMMLLICLLYRLKKQKEKKKDEVREREAQEALLKQQHTDKLLEQEHEMSALKAKAERVEALESENARLKEETTEKNKQIEKQDKDIMDKDKQIEKNEENRLKELQERDEDEHLRQSELLKSVANGRNSDMRRLTQGVNSGFGSPTSVHSIGQSGMSGMNYPLSTNYASTASPPHPGSPTLPQDSMKITLKPTGRAKGL